MNQNGGKNYRRKCLEENLNILGCLYLDETDKFYQEFVQKAIETDGPFLSRGIPVSGGFDNDGERGPVIALLAEFPSGHQYPIFTYFVDQQAFMPPIDAMNPYNVLCESIKGNMADRRNLVQRLSQIDDEGSLLEIGEEGDMYQVQAFYREDVPFAREIFNQASPTS